VAISLARQAAFDILLRIETTAAYSDELLNSRLTAHLDDRDRALTFEVVLGTLRRQGEIDRLIAQRSRRPLAGLDAEVRTALRMGCYQIRYLDRIPDRAAVSEGVDLVKRARKSSAAGMVNAILRRLPERPRPEESAEWSHPKWLRQRWQQAFGEAAAEALLQANLQAPRTYLRLNTRYPVDETVRRLDEEGVATEETEMPSCRLVVKGRPALTESRKQGRIRVRDISSQMVVPMLQLQPGCSFLDLCAAPGGKTFQALETLIPGELSSLTSHSAAIACDRRLHRLRTMRELATESIDMVSLDAETALPFQRTFDRILVDAPCSGTGTLARNPEIKWRLGPGDIETLRYRQARILANGLMALSPGGVLVYATCSLEPEENREVVDEVLMERTEFAADAYMTRVPGRDAGDGFFACRIVRVSGG
jgi:16S rRNA (cytosine967-C5)-methyltransferase